LNVFLNTSALNLGTATNKSSANDTNYGAAPPKATVVPLMPTTQWWQAVLQQPTRTAVQPLQAATTA